MTRRGARCSGIALERVGVGPLCPRHDPAESKINELKIGDRTAQPRAESGSPSWPGHARVDARIGAGNPAGSLLYHALRCAGESWTSIISGVSFATAFDEHAIEPTMQRSLEGGDGSNRSRCKWTREVPERDRRRRSASSLLCPHPTQPARHRCGVRPGSSLTETRTGQGRGPGKLRLCGLESRNDRCGR